MVGTDANPKNKMHSINNNAFRNTNLATLPGLVVVGPYDGQKAKAADYTNFNVCPIRNLKQ